MELGLGERGSRGWCGGPGVQESSSLLVELLGRRGPGMIHNERGPRGLSDYQSLFSLSEIGCSEGKSACSRSPTAPPLPRVSHLALNHQLTLQINNVSAMLVLARPTLSEEWVGSPQGGRGFLQPKSLGLRDDCARCKGRCCCEE